MGGCHRGADLHRHGGGHGDADRQLEAVGYLARGRCWPCGHRGRGVAAAQQREADQLSGDYRLRYVALRGLVFVVVAMYALASCGQSRAATTPTIEYRLPTIFVTPGIWSATPTLEIPAETPTPTRKIGITPTATPEQFKPAITVPTAFQVSGQSLEKPAPVGTNATLAAAGWPSYLWPWANGIIWRESRGQAWAVNASSGAAGWFQIMPSTWAEMGCWGDPLVAYDNAVCAWRLYLMAGVSPWAVG